MVTFESVIGPRDQDDAVNAEFSKAELNDQLELIGLALRALMTRVSELETDVVRLQRAAEQARAVTAQEVARRVIGDHELGRLRPYEALIDECQASARELQRALEELHATKLLRWSARPRRWYGALRKLGGGRR
jgi:adenylosuccinate lyase